MKAVIIDNYDSFTYNLYHLIRETGTDTTVLRNDAFDLKDIEAYDKIILSPGPGHSGRSRTAIRRHPYLCRTKADTWRMSRASSHRPSFWRTACQPVRCVPRRTDSLFPNGKRLYFPRHPQAIPRRTLPLVGGIGRRPPFLPRSDGGQPEGQIMALRHREYDIHGIQFHPESVLTPNGRDIVENFLGHTLCP